MHKSVQNHISRAELEVLRTLGERVEASADSVTAEIAEISATTGIQDSDEVLRALYTLEGKNFVQPEPAGDLTSHHWKITEIGVRALRMLNL